jgi:hypothetical protein
MSLADLVGATGTFLNLPSDATGTTTLESKTNFFAGALRCLCLPCGSHRVSTPAGFKPALTVRHALVVTAPISRSVKFRASNDPRGRGQLLE